MSEESKFGEVRGLFLNAIVILGTIGVAFGGYKALFKDKDEFLRFCSMYFWVWWSIAFIAALLYCKFG